MTSTHRAAAGAAAPRQRAAQRRHPADQLTGCIHALEELERDTRSMLDTQARRFPQARIDELEERAQALAAAIVGAFRGDARPTAKPLWVSPDGRGMLF